jgi:hypothetical protein
MRGLGDAAINRTDAGLNGPFSAATRVHKTIAAVRKLEVVRRLQAHFQRLAHRAMGQSVGSKVIATHGCVGERQASGQLERSLHVVARFVAKAMVPSAVSGDATRVAVRRRRFDWTTYIRVHNGRETRLARPYWPCSAEVVRPVA